MPRTPPRTKARAYRGPCAMLSPAEAARVADALRNSDDDLAVAIVEKCRATVGADPSWRKPLR